MEPETSVPGNVQDLDLAEGTGTYPQLPSGARLLAVDDDPLTRRALHRAMTLAGFQVSTADDVGPALAAAELVPPDVAIVDMGMPTEGLELVRQLRARYGASVHIAMFSARRDEASQQTAFAAGADDYLIKPLNALDLQRRMMAAARKQRAFVESRQAREHANQLRAYSAEAAALLAHDLNNGLATGLSNATYLAQVANLDDDQRQALDATLRALRRMAGLVTNFVDISRFEDSAIQPRPTRVSVRALLLDTVTMHTASPASGIALKTACDDELIAHFDAALIERVLHNLVGNAMRYCRKGGSVRVTARAYDTPDHAHGVELTVANTGPQIPDDVAAHLFSKYGRGSNGKRGMGLYFCKLACRAHGGSIALVPEADGPSFRVRLPGISAM